MSEDELAQLQEKLKDYEALEFELSCVRSRLEEMEQEVEIFSKAVNVLDEEREALLKELKSYREKE